MMKKNFKVEIIPFPKSRNIVVDALREGKKEHHAYGFGEVDVTKSLRIIEEIKNKTGYKPSFTAFVLYCVAKSIEEYKEVQAVQKGKKLYIFDEIDISTMIERETKEGKTVPATIIIRNANKKTFNELNTEIRNAQKSKFDGISLGSSREAKKTNFFINLPRFIRNFLWMKIKRDPEFRKKIMGTVQVTAVGMFGTKGGYAMTPTPWPLSIVVGGIVHRPMYSENNEIEPHDLLCLTIAVNHNVIDGGPGARFIAKMVNFLEEGIGLPEHF